ncbi:MAG: hypothetical protein N4J56_001893 [Chroococcidiopsis sp. SAG 2025]|nr:hypothetical protein [Chroococcidiopsis sp. SAG 2025]
MSCDPWGLSVTPQHFAEQLQVLRQYTQLTQLRRLSQDVAEGKHHRRNVVVTFDDGYADNLHNAKPILERYDVPATIFVTSGYVDREREFWWDELERLFLQPGALPQQLELNINGCQYQWDLGEFANYTESTYQQHRYWKAEREEPPTPRQLVYYEIWKLLRVLPEGDRDRILDRLLAWAGMTAGSRSTHRSLSLAEVAVLERGSLVEVGAHTIAHPFLCSLPLSSQKQEIYHSKAQLEELLGHEVTSFSYPFGNYTSDSVAIVRDAGYDCACATIHASVQRHSNLFELPRVEIQDWNGEEFARRLSRWFDV